MFTAFLSPLSVFLYSRDEEFAHKAEFALAQKAEFAQKRGIGTKSGI